MTTLDGFKVIEVTDIIDPDWWLLNKTDKILYAGPEMLEWIKIIDEERRAMNGIKKGKHEQDKNT